MTPIPRRFCVVATAGSGKTTVARQIAHRLRIPHVELDALYSGLDRTPVPLPLFCRRVTDAISRNAWVADGNYNVVRDLVWHRAKALVWLDYGLYLVVADRPPYPLEEHRSRTALEREP